MVSSRLRSSSRLVRRAIALGFVAIVAPSCTPPRAGASADAGAEGGASLLDGAARANDAGDAATAPSAPDAAATDDSSIPPASSDELTQRTKHLLEAIVRDDPELANDVLFPRDAFVTVKDSNDPGKFWDTKVAASFKKHIHHLHKQQMKDGVAVQFGAFEIGRSIVQVEPKKHEFKVPLWKVKHSKVTYTEGDRTKRLEIDEMISWKGAWYITKLR